MFFLSITQVSRFVYVWSAKKISDKKLFWIYRAMIWDEFLRHFRFCDEEDSGLSDEEQERKGPKNRPKHTRKRIHQAKKNFLEKFKTASNLFSGYESMYDWRVQYLFQAVFLLRSPYQNRTVSISRTYGFQLENVRFWYGNHKRMMAGLII